MNSDNDLAQQPHPTKQKQSNSFRSLKPLVLFGGVILSVIVIAGTGGYLLGIRYNESAPKLQILPSPQVTIITQISPIISPSQPSVSNIPIQAIPTSSWKIYRNEKLGFEFKLLEPYDVMEETSNSVSFSYSGIPAFTIYTNQTIDYKVLKPCKSGNEAYEQFFPCLWDVTEETSLGGVSAKGFSIVEGLPDRGYYIVQTIDYPTIEAKMSLAVGVGGLYSSFKQMLSTFKFLDNI